MILKLKLITISTLSAFALLLMLCLGAQNLNSREELKLGFATTAPLPSGFLIGVSIALGVVSGGIATALIMPDSRS